MDNRDADHHRHSIRLKGYDYAQPGAYFITICTHNRERIFGEVVDVGVRLSEYGGVVRDEWLRTASVRREVMLDTFIIMPDHMHAIVMFRDEGFEASMPLPPSTGLHRRPRSLATLVSGFKGAVTSRINTVRGTPSQPVWQRNYHERVIRDEAALAKMREYIVTNPVRWMHRRDPSH
ncbi:MAG: hypothetical protein K1X39_02555 [Thermoflexales bacterium]|nr:hypothetical protein [Thermoflexales bacterium]